MNIDNQLKNYQHVNNLDIVYSNSNYFKIVRKDNHHGFVINVAPNTNCFELYMIINNQMTTTATHTMNNANDIMNFIFNKLMIDICIKNKLIDIDNILSTSINNYYIQVNNYTISVLENNSQNGYYIYFDFDSYACIGYVKNNRYIDLNSIKVNNIDSLVTTLKSLVMNNINYDNNLTYDSNGDELNTTMDSDISEDPE
jgi:hypothetical protein